MTSKPSTLAEYVAELDRLIEQPLPSFDPMNPNSAMKFVKASILKNHRLNTAGVLRDLVETAGDRPVAPLTTWTDKNGTRQAGFLSYDEAMQQAYDWNERASQTEERLAHEQEANARLLKTIEEVCRERDDLSRRLSDIVDFVLGGDKPADPEPGQCWRSINKSYIYRQVDNQVLLWGPSSDTALHGRQWVETVFESLRNLEDHIGDLEPVENPENNA